MIANSCKVLLKGRPTRAQLADRLAKPAPPGMELYLDARDVGDTERLRKLAVRLNELRPSDQFVYVVEGPLRSLDGTFFDISVDTEAQRECIRRIAWLSKEIGAEAVLVHAIAPRKMAAGLNDEVHQSTLKASLPFVGHFVDMVQGIGLTPMLENIPPVARQRESAYMCTPVGMMASDLAFFGERFPGLKATLDVSHAQLFLNGTRMTVDGVPREIAPLVRYLSSLGEAGQDRRERQDRDSEMNGVAPDMEAYVRTLEPYLFEAHVSNARGILDEGLPYGDGDMNLDALAVRLSKTVRYLVTETIEPDADNAIHMREARTRMEAALASAG